MFANELLTHFYSKSYVSGQTKKFHSVCQQLYHIDPPHHR